MLGTLVALPVLALLPSATMLEPAMPRAARSLESDSLS